MEITQKQKLDKHIRQKIKSLKKDVESFKKLTEPVSPDNAIGRITRMEAINSKSINEAALNKAKYTLSKLEEALPKINDPDFGLCTECEEPIPFARLMIMPETGFCVKCAERMGG
ncbi:TraR/DksA C4-type zinc finger protein [Desulfobacterales bacterium HSG16]|nr:TraR/DksA C4-type zinc finger protein [Desulfobacterales bacterium HSG16]